MSIENHVPDGTFVKEIAELVNPKFVLDRLRDGREILTGGADFVPQVYGIASLPYPQTIELSTLDGIAEAYKDLQDRLKASAVGAGSDELIVHVLSPRKVFISAPRVGEKNQVFEYYAADAIIPDTKIGEHLDIDMAILNLNANFEETVEREKLLTMLGSITSGLASDIVDDGVAQQVTTKRGITRAGTETFKNPITLQPYRTFPEITQPQSPFVVRLKQVKNDDDSLTARVSLHEADGGRWRVKAIADIAKYLRANLPDAVILA